MLNKHKRVDISTNKQLIGKYIIDISTKDNRFQRFIINNEQNILYHNLKNILSHKDLTHFYQFAKRYREYSPVNVDGWLIYDPLEEYKRQQINFDNDVSKIAKLSLH